MASDNEASCVSDPNFAVICSFLEYFGKSCGISYPDIGKLQTMLEDSHDVPQPLIDLHIKLLRKTRKSVSAEKWEKALVKFCHTYSNQDGWEVERFGYKKVRTAVKVRLLKVLLESQFDLNQKFKNEVNKLSANELRLEPLGRDKTGQSYWFQLDEECNMRVYREDLDEESWELVAKDREGVVNLITTLSDGEAAPIPINEDSNSLEISEKPITDTGQVSSSPSLDSDPPENGETSPTTPPNPPQPAKPTENIEPEDSESSEASDLTHDSSNPSQDDSSQDSEAPAPPTLTKNGPTVVPKKTEVLLDPQKALKPSEPPKPVLKAIETPVIIASPPKPPQRPLQAPSNTSDLGKPQKTLDKLVTTISRLQSEKPGASKLEKIAENLARTSGISMKSGDEDLGPQDFTKTRGMDLTAPRGFDSSKDPPRPVDFSGMDLSKSSFREDIQSLSIDLSTKKPKQESPYDRPPLRNTIDLTKRQVFTYEMYHQRPKDDHRLPNYSILPDPSKLSMRMKRAHDEDLQDLPKRLRTEALPMRKRRDEPGPAIEEPLMMVQGEGSGSDCDAAPHPEHPEESEALELGEPIEDKFFFQGEGNGYDCDTGNPGDDTSNDNKESNESKDNCEDVKKDGGVKSLVNDCEGEKSNCQGSSGSPKKFKPTLGVQVFTKSSGSTSKRLSRWDVREIEEKRECDSSIIDSVTFSGNDIDGKSVEAISSTTSQNSVTSSRSFEVSSAGEAEGEADHAPRFFFGPNCVSYTSEAAGKCSGDDVEVKESTGDTPQSSSAVVEPAEASRSDDLKDFVTNSESRVESTGVDSSEVVSTVDDGKLEAMEPETSCPDEMGLEEGIDSTGDSMIPEFSGTSRGRDDSGDDGGVAPAPIVDGNALKSPERINIGQEESSEVRNNDGEDNRSVSLDQDSNEAMVIDDRGSDSSESNRDGGKCVADSFGEIPEELIPSRDASPSTKEEERELDEVLESIDTDSKAEGDSRADEVEFKGKGDALEFQEKVGILAETSKEDLQGGMAQEISADCRENLEVDGKILTRSQDEGLKKAGEVGAEGGDDREVVEAPLEGGEPDIEPETVTSEVVSTGHEENSEITGGIPSRSEHVEPEVEKSEGVPEECQEIPVNAEEIPSEGDKVESEVQESAINSPENDENSQISEEMPSEAENVEPEIEKSGEISPQSEENIPTPSEIPEEPQENPQDELRSPESEIPAEEPSEEVSTTSDRSPTLKPDENFSEIVSTSSEIRSESPAPVVIPEEPKNPEVPAAEEVLVEPLPPPADAQSKPKPSLASQASLVANYGSDDSNLLGSDDVFEAEVNPGPREGDSIPKEAEEPTEFQSVPVPEEVHSVSEGPLVPREIKPSEDLEEVPEEVSEVPEEVPEVPEEVPEVPEEADPISADPEVPDAVKPIPKALEDHPEVESPPEAPEEAPEGVKSIPETSEPLPGVEAVSKPVEVLPENSSEVQSTSDSPEASREAQTVLQNPPEASERGDVSEPPEIPEETPPVDPQIQKEIDSAPRLDQELSKPEVTPEPEEASFSERSLDSPDMFDSSKPETPIEIDNQDIEKIAATLNEDDDDDDEPPKLQIEMKESSSPSEAPETPEEMAELSSQPPEEDSSKDSTKNPPYLHETKSEDSPKPQDPLEKPSEDSLPQEAPAVESQFPPEVPEEVETKESQVTPEVPQEIEPEKCQLSHEIPQEVQPEELPREGPLPAELPQESLPEEKAEESPSVLQRPPEFSALAVSQKTEEESPAPAVLETLSKEKTPEPEGIIVNDHQKKDRESDEDTSPIHQVSKRPRTESEAPKSQPRSPEIPQKDRNSLLSQDLKPSKNLLHNLPQITLTMAHEKPDLKKEASKRLHLEQDPEDLPPIKSRPSKTDFIKDEVNDVKREQKPTDIKSEGLNNLESRLNPAEAFKPADLSVNPLKMSDDSEDSMGIDNDCLYEAPLNNMDPLADEDETKSEPGPPKLEIESPKLGVIKIREVRELQYPNWKMDSPEPLSPQAPPKLSRKRRNSANDSNSEEQSRLQEQDDAGGKRMKLRGKRMPDVKLRKSVEANRVEPSSDEDARPLAEVLKVVDEKPAEETTSIPPDDSQKEPKPKGRPRGRKRKVFKGKGRPPLAKKESPGVEAPQESESPKPPESLKTEETSPAQKKRKKRKMVLGLEIGIDIVEDQENSGETRVRQSRRIAQIKIKEEADRRRIEEETLETLKTSKDKRDDDKSKKKRRKHKDSDEEVRIREVDRFLKDKDKQKEKDKEKDKSKKKRRKRKKKEVMMKFNEAKPWQSSSGSSSDTEEHEEEEEEEPESEGSILFKSDHEFSPESDLEKDAESEPLRRARTAQKSEERPEEADEYACQKCGKADHPEWILLCDTCDKGWHCSCLRPALMLIPEGDWFCPPCQHTLLINKLRESLKTYDQNVKKHENEVLRKKRLAYVGISLDNVLPKNEVARRSAHRSADDDSEEESGEESGSHVASDSNESSSSSSSESGSSSSESSSEESEPVYQLRERRCANTSYKFNEYDDMINAAIQDEVEAVQGAGNQGRGKDISTIVNAEKEEAQEAFEKRNEGIEETADKQSDKDSDKDYAVEREEDEEDEEVRKKVVVRKSLGKKKHRKLNSLDISSEDDPESDEDFKGSSSDYEEDYEDQMISSDDSYTDTRRKGKRDTRPVRRSTRAARRQRYDEDFINDDSDDSDRPKRKKSRSIWDEESESEESDNSWRSRRKRSKGSSLPRLRAAATKSKAKKKKKRKRIVQMDSDNGSDNEGEEEKMGAPPPAEIDAPVEREELPPELDKLEEKKEVETTLTEEVSKEERPPVLQEQKPEVEIARPEENISGEEPPSEVHPELQTLPQELPPQLVAETPDLEKKKEKKKREKAIRRKIIYGGLPEDRPPEDDEPMGRRTRGRKINYQVDAIMSDSEEELKKALRKTEDSEDEFVMNDGEDHKEDPDKNSDSADDEYSPQKTAGGKHKSPKNRRSKKSPAGRKTSDNGEPKQRKKPGPKPGSKNKPRLSKSPGGSITLEGTPSIGEVEGSLASLAPEELGDLNDEQLAQMMMEDEEYGRRQLELAAIEIAKNKKKEEREAKKLEKARQKALEILAAEQQRDPNAPEGVDGEAPKKKKRGRRSKAEILAEQIRRGADPALAVLPPTLPGMPAAVAAVPGVLPGASGGPEGAAPPGLPLSVSPGMPSLPGVSILPVDLEGPQEHLIPSQLITGPDGQLLNPDGSPLKPKRRGRGKGKKTLAMEAARAEAAAKAAGLGDPDSRPDDMSNILPTPGSSTSGSAPSTPPLASVSQGLPVTQPQSIYPLPGQQSSVITRMLQAQPISSSAPQSFTAAAAAMGQKYFGVPNANIMGGRGGYDIPRGRIPSPYNSRPGGSGLPVHFAVRSGAPPMRMRVPGPSQLYHTPHHPMDPSPSGGGPISITTRDRSSPLGPGAAMIPPSAGSPLAKGGPTPPPPPYVRGGPLARFGDNQIASRHPIPPFTSSGNHSVQQPSPPPNRPGNFSPYHPQPPPNYHYGAYPPPPMSSDDAAYQGSPYPSEHFANQSENPPAPPVQPPPANQGGSSQGSHTAGVPTGHSSAHPSANPPSEGGTPGPQGHGPHGKYDEEGTGEFGGLVSYFSSQREDDLDS